MKFSFLITSFLWLLVSVSAHGSTLDLTPDHALYSGDDCTSSCGPGTKEILTWLEDEDNVPEGFDRDDETYKSEAGDVASGTDSGIFADLYSTKFTNPVGDPSDATISWDGGDYLEGADWLLVKDGDNAPVWYLFSLAEWDGMMDIVLTGFWPGAKNGAISFVAIYGGDAVPEPGTLALFGIGLAGMGLARRKKKA